MAVQQVINGSSTTAQRRALVFAGRRLRMDVDALRNLTPRGSLRALSFTEASALLDRLNEGRETPKQTSRPKRKATQQTTGGNGQKSKPGVFKMMTPQQRHMIVTLRTRLDWSPAHLDNFLKRSFGLTVATLGRRHDASRVIIAMNKVLDHVVAKVDFFSEDLPRSEGDACRVGLCGPTRQRVLIVKCEGTRHDE